VTTDPDRLMKVCDLSGYVSPRLDQAVPARRAGRISAPSGIGLGVSPDLDLLGQADQIVD
jgi:hypothetical protein